MGLHSETRFDWHMRNALHVILARLAQKELTVPDAAQAMYDRGVPYHVQERILNHHEAHHARL